MRAALVFLVLAPLGAAAQAQDVTNVPQITSPATADTPPMQIDQSPAPLPPQLSANSDSVPAQAQLTTVAQSDGQPSQVSTAPRNAQPPHPLSRPEEGRTAAVARVEGKDRCDPENLQDRKSAECRHVIETRSADFARPSPAELSPEQKLLLDQQLLASDGSLSGATRRLANTGSPDNSIEAMGVASIVLTQSEPKQDKKPDRDQQTNAAIQAVLGVLNGPPPQ